MAGTTLALRVRPESVRRILLAAVAVVTTVGLLVEWMEYRAPWLDPGILVPTFSLSYEANVPTWFASSQLLLCSIVLACVARASQHRTRHWWGLCLGFLYISMDEAVGVHEAASSWFETDGLLYYGWVIPAAALVVVLAGIYARFTWELPPRVRSACIVAGSLYVGGALLMELPLGYWADTFGSENFGYAAIDLVEETMEMVGVSLFLTALVDYLSIQQIALRVGFGHAEPDRST